LKKVSLHIEKPCQESWDAMQPQQGCRYCSSCAKTVTDFTEMRDTEILNFLSHQKGEVCGRLKLSQTQRVLTLRHHHSSWQRAVALLLPALIGVSAAQAQKTFSELKTEMVCDTKNDSIPVQSQAFDIHENCARRFKVIDADSKEPLAFCNISCSNGQYGVVSDPEGNFTFEKVQAPLHLNDTITINYVGYYPKIMTLQQLMASPGSTVTLVQMELVVMGALVQKRTVINPFRYAYYRLKRLFTIY
jgi:hypothetical protein